MMGYLILFLFLASHSQTTFDAGAESCHLACYTSYEVDETKARLKKKLLAEAKKLKGTKYKYGGHSAKGMDCSGFVHHLYHQIKIDLPRSSSLQVTKGRKVKLSQAEAGDLIFFKRKNKVNHVAMVVHRNAKQLIIVHATSSKGVIFEDLNSSAYWKNKVFVAKRLI